MVEERITTVENGTAAPSTHTTIIHDGEPARSGGGSTMIVVLLLVVALVAGLYIYNRSTSSEAAKDNAVAGAANSVSDAAAKMGNAAENAADKITDK
jgi:flagellar basal body-associated protein FliL